MSVDVVGGAAGLAPAARLLASWWSPPTADEIARWELPDELRAVFERTTPEALREEYERLFVGPGRTPCPPYESVWRAGQARRDQGRLMASCAADVARLYASLGIRVRAAAHELPDHLVIELEALAYALDRDDAGAAAALARDHLAAWVPAFCAAVAAETTEPFYAALASWTAALAA